jgi:hypothetical protein
MFRMFRSRATRSPDTVLSRFNLGEILCEVYEWFHASFPDSIMKFDQLHLLATGILKGEAIGLGNCKCGATILVDLLLTSRRRICWACQRKKSIIALTRCQRN